MAIHWQYLKGLNAESSNPMYYTFIVFSKNLTSTPTIYTSAENNLTNATSLGNIITSNAEGQAINKRFTFTNNVILSANSILYFGDQSIQRKNNALLLPNIETGTIKTSSLIQAKEIKSTSKITAAAFYATSDKRAKDNIHKLNIDSLHILNQIPLYTFKYKGDEERSIGVIAQDLVNLNIDGFNLVSNPSATGKDNDYMSVKETKLVYLLIDAVQKQSEIINQLKTDMEELKNELKNR